MAVTNRKRAYDGSLLLERLCARPGCHTVFTGRLRSYEIFCRPCRERLDCWHVGEWRMRGRYAA